MCFFMFGASLKVTNSDFQNCKTFCRSIYMKIRMRSTDTESKYLNLN